MKTLAFITLSIFSDEKPKLNELTTEVIIQATPEEVWKVFTQFHTYPSWNPFVKLLEGTIEEGEKINVTVQDMKFKPTVLDFEPNKEFRWIGHLLIKGIFDGEHYFRLIDNGDGTTTFIQGEHFKGILLPLLRKKLETEIYQGFKDMNQVLKERVESSTR